MFLIYFLFFLSKALKSLGEKKKRNLDLPEFRASTIRLENVKAGHSTLCFWKG